MRTRRQFREAFSVMAFRIRRVLPGYARGYTSEADKPYGLGNKAAVFGVSRKLPLPTGGTR